MLCHGWNVSAHNLSPGEVQHPQEEKCRRFSSSSAATILRRSLRFLVRMDPAAVEMDGSVMEGGGQILRLSASLSCITGTPVKITKIRAGRSTPGLRPQHLSGLQLVSDLCSGSLQGATIGSTDISLSPGKIHGGNHTADTQTAGSVCLLMQVALPCALFSDGVSQLCLKGGTNAEMAPQIDYTVKVFKPIVEKFGVHFDCDIRMRGYYPKGGGEVMVTVNPVKELQPVVMTERGNITKIYGRAFVAGVLPFKLAKDMSAAAVRAIRKEIKELYINIQPLQEKDKACGNGNGIIIIAESSTGCVFAGSALGKKGVYADKIGIEAAEMLLRNIRHNGCVDEFLQDQLIIFMAMAKGRSRIRTGAVTLHTQTAIHIAEQLTQAKFTITKSEEQLSGSVTYIIECEGSGLTNPSL
ncbi:RNA 3'-terminal phosphate cyclase [Antennarius striatus]|uniref:RNA 3'-terminal phosphate cyclase n=1 Tax=Antennarius striatus TaxID=241820 RepID=UPI0035AF1CBC